MHNFDREGGREGGREGREGGRGKRERKEGIMKGQLSYFHYQ